MSKSRSHRVTAALTAGVLIGAFGIYGLFVWIGKEAFAELVWLALTVTVAVGFYAAVWSICESIVNRMNSGRGQK